MASLAILITPINVLTLDGTLRARSPGDKRHPQPRVRTDSRRFSTRSVPRTVTTLAPSVA